MIWQSSKSHDPQRGPEPETHSENVFALSPEQLVELRELVPLYIDIDTNALKCP